MGCRAAVGVSNEILGSELEEFVKGIVCLAYPLHPQGEHNKLRDEPLKTLDHPILFVSGTKDDMADQDLLKTAVADIPSDAQIHWVEGADHSHKISRFKEKETNEQILNVVGEWCDNIITGTSEKKTETKGKNNDHVTSSADSEVKDKGDKGKKRKSEASEDDSKKSKK